MVNFICHENETHKYASASVNENTDLKKIYAQVVYTAKVSAGRPDPWSPIS